MQCFLSYEALPEHAWSHRDRKVLRHRQPSAFSKLSLAFLLILFTWLKMSSKDSVVLRVINLILLCIVFSR